MNQQFSRRDIEEAKKNDKIFAFDEKEQERQREGRPWGKDHHYFKKVKLSALALLKMVMHAADGGRFEIMGLMTGKIDGDTLIILDSFATPAKGSEVEVSAGAREIEFMAQYTHTSAELGRNEPCIGWYHSHPGYGCWLSGIDVNTQRQCQMYQDPWLAIVVDPVQTVSSGKVEIGAFRTYPANYTPPNTGPSEYQSIPEDKIEDFGVYHTQYYKIPIELYKSSSDEKQLSLLWNKYWVNTLSSSPLITNKDFTSKQISDVALKLKKTDSELSKRFSFHHHMMFDGGKGGDGKGKKQSSLSKLNADNVKLTTEALNGIMALEIKKALFNVDL